MQKRQKHEQQQQRRKTNICSEWASSVTWKPKIIWPDEVNGLVVASSSTSESPSECGRCFQTDKRLELSAGLLANVWQRRLNAEASSQSDVAGLCRCTLWKNAFQLRLTLRPTHIHMHRVYNCTLKWVRTSLVSDFVSGIQFLSDNLV